MPKNHILIIEDEASIRKGLEDALSLEGFKVFTADDGEKGLKAVKAKKPDLILLDIMLPKLSGFELCKQIRSDGISIPVIMLTAKGEEVDKVIGLEIGADDYITKPFSTRELISRIKAVLRRTETKEPKSSDLEVFTFGKVSINLKTYEVQKNGKKSALSAMEAKVMKFFIEHANEVIPRDKLLDEVWGYEQFPSTRTVDNFIVKLRIKIEDDPKNPKHLHTIYGAGYKFIP